LELELGIKREIKQHWTAIRPGAEDGDGMLISTAYTLKACCQFFAHFNLILLITEQEGPQSITHQQYNTTDGFFTNL
jgi:hypothetical protein